MKHRFPMFNKYLAQWSLAPDGEPIMTHSSRLLPVRWNTIPAMLKVALSEEEALGNALMPWWNGQGAARVLAQDGNAILVERATGPNSLSSYSRNGQDETACRIICSAVAKLHRPRPGPVPELPSLQSWFGNLQPAAAHGGILGFAAATAETLLMEPRDIAVLHGDIHHGNILDFGERGWLAIDPKGVLGERGFDYANLFCNPDYDIATAPTIFQRRINIVSSAAGIDDTRLLQWTLAWAGLSAAWSIADALSPRTALAVAELAAAELRQK